MSNKAHKYKNTLDIQSTIKHRRMIIQGVFYTNFKTFYKIRKTIYFFILAVTRKVCYQHIGPILLHLFHYRH